MELTEFIEKYRVSNFETYLKDDASIEYWQNLIIEFTKDFAPLKSNIQILSNPALKRPNENIFAISFGKFCQEQIELIEIKNKFNLIAPIDSEYNTEHLDIFKPKGFELWDALYKEFDVKKHNSKDLNFMYSQMKYDGYISSIVTLSNMEQWLNTWYKLNENYRLRDYLLGLQNNPTIKRFTIYNQIKSNM
jgi:hypothetical protein